MWKLHIFHDPFFLHPLPEVAGNYSYIVTQSLNNKTEQQEVVVLFWAKINFKTANYCNGIIQLLKKKKKLQHYYSINEELYENSVSQHI